MSSRVTSNHFIHIPLPAVVISVGLHLLALSLFLLTPQLEKVGIHLFPKKKDIFKDAYQSFIQVDVVALPDDMKSDRNTIDTSLSITEKPSGEVAPEPKALEKQEKDALTFPDEAGLAKAEKAKEAKKKLDAEAAREKKREKEQETALKKLELEAKREQALQTLQNKAGKAGRKKISGNVLSKGTALNGLIGTAKDQYAARILEAIKQNFNIYLWQQKKDLSAVIQLEFFPTGKVRNRKVIMRSNDPTYDSAVLQAIDATVFPPPEDTAILEEAFNITFVPH